MIAPCINFMQIKALMPHAINPQLGLKGSVVNIPVEINDMLNILPRNFDNMQTIQLKLKRHVEHSTDYMYETIRPAVVCDALMFLKTKPLYKNIEISESFLKKYDKQYDAKIDFIVDESDVQEHETNAKSEPSANVEDDLNDIDLEAIFNIDFDTNDECMLIDRNKEVSNNIQIIAPGQGKLPVPWMTPKSQYK